MMNKNDFDVFALLLIPDADADAATIVFFIHIQKSFND